MDQFPDFDYSSSFDESLYDLLHSPEMEMEKATEWSFEEQKALENALAEVADPSSPAFIDNVAARLPWRSTDDIISHYQALLNDVEMIESGNVPLPNYQPPPPHHVDAPQKQDDEVVVVVAAKNNHRDEGSSSNPRSKSGHPRRRGVPWTEDEHQLFLMGLNKYGKGDWRSISRFYVITKTPTQVASHAQKYFRRVASSTPMDRRRPSIHDIQTVNPTAFPMLHHQQPFNGGGGGGGQLLLDQNPMFPHYPAPINYAANFSQPAPYAGPPSYAAPSSYLLPPNMMNQQHWG